MPVAPWASGSCKEPLLAPLRPLSLRTPPPTTPSMSPPRVACLSWAQQCLFTLMPAGRWLRDQSSWLVWEHPGLGTKNRQNHIEATEVGIACRRGSGGWKGVVGRLLESWEPSPPGLAWVLAPRSGQSVGLNGRTHTVCARPMRLLLHQQRRKALAFLPVPLGSSCQLSRHAGWSAWRWSRGSCPTMGLKGPQNKSLRGQSW